VARPVSIFLALWIASPALVPSARADVIMPRPIDCPRGAIAGATHAGPHCAPTTCVAAADCDALRAASGAASYECAEAGLCIATRASTGGWRGRFELEVAVAACAQPSDCPAESTCVLAQRCIASGAPSTEPAPGGGADARAAAAREAAARDAAAREAAAHRAAGGGPTVAITVVVTIVVLLAIAALVFGVLGRRTARIDAEEVRALLDRRGAISHRELATRVGEHAIGRALAPLAAEVRVDVDEDGEVIYALRDDRDRGARRSS
jgi:hypothetical protein